MDKFDTQDVDFELLWVSILAMLLSIANFFIIMHGFYKTSKQIKKLQQAYDRRVKAEIKKS